MRAGKSRALAGGPEGAEAAAVIEPAHWRHNHVVIPLPSLPHPSSTFQRDMAPEEDGRGEKPHDNPPNRVKFHEDISGSDAHPHANPREHKRRACELDSAGNESSSRKPEADAQEILPPRQQWGSLRMAQAFCTFRQQSSSVHLADTGARWNPDDLQRSSKKAKQECESRTSRSGASPGSQTIYLQNQRPLSKEVLQEEIVRRAACFAQPPLLAQMGIQRIMPAEQAVIQHRANAILGLLLGCVESAEKKVDHVEADPDVLDDASSRPATTESDSGGGGKG